MDCVDISSLHETVYQEAKVREVQRSTPRRVEPVGYCHACFEDLEPGKLYCDQHCAQAHAKSLDVAKGH